EKHYSIDISRLPFLIRVLLESMLRQADGSLIKEEHILLLGPWVQEIDNSKDNSRSGKETQHNNPGKEIPFLPSRIIMQDFTGVPAVVDLASMRDAVARYNMDPDTINPCIPVDLVIDHSIQVDCYGTLRAPECNTRLEYERNAERYRFLKWGSDAFSNFRVIPPGTGIIHQVNLEYLAQVVRTDNQNNKPVAFPDTLLGTDSHTTMINGLGVLGWGVGGIEAEAALLGVPVYIPFPQVIGLRLDGRLPEGTTATDLVLTITRLLRKKGVVGKMIEVFGPGVDTLSLADRATVSNMCPEYGATVTFFPVDRTTLSYLTTTGREDQQVSLVEAYTKAQGLFRGKDSPQPLYNQIVELDMGEVSPCIAGPKRPHDYIPLHKAKTKFTEMIKKEHPQKHSKTVEHKQAGSVNYNTNNVYQDSFPEGPEQSKHAELTHGSVVIAAITSCTNTSNPSVIFAAALMAKKAVELGVRPVWYVKTSLAPGSRVVTRYLRNSGLLGYLEALGFHVVGYGCTTCIGNSGELGPLVKKEVEGKNLVVASVVSANRNFEGRIHSLVKANYLASPPLVVAYAIAGTMNIDLSRQPLGFDPNGKGVYLNDIWPSSDEIESLQNTYLHTDLYQEEYSRALCGNRMWDQLSAPSGKVYSWNASSTYIRKPPFFDDLEAPLCKGKIENARVLLLLGDTVTTDHLSPAGAISQQSPAGRWLMEQGVEPEDFNTYGARRGNHQVMARGSFANIRIRNKLVGYLEGGYTIYLPTGEETSVFDAAVKYQGDQTPLIIIASREYGTGSSRDWAAKGTALLGVKAVIAESFERIHRSNLVGMGVLPLQFMEKENASTLGLSGKEVYTIGPVKTPAQELKVTVHNDPAQEKPSFSFKVRARIDTPFELEYYRNGGVLQNTLKKMIW
ncbi:MAG: aconitate hydratase AcnA, partial [Spirochaetota bacterium]